MAGRLESLQGLLHPDLHILQPLLNAELAHHLVVLEGDLLGFR